MDRNTAFAGRGCPVAAFLLVLMCALYPPPAWSYDLASRGVPKFVSTVYIDLTKIQRISKFRSSAGHDYSDWSQFREGGIKDSAGHVENCRSMKHYFAAPDSTVKIVSPVSGTVSTLREESLGMQIEITSDAQPDFRFIIFHVNLAAPLTIGQHLSEGQFLGHHIGLETWSDIAVWVQTPGGRHLVSYFETLTDAAFEVFRGRGAGTRETFVRTKQDRDAEGCSYFFSSDADFILLSGETPARQQIEVATVLPRTMNVGDAPVEISAAATSGLPIALVSASPKVCGIEGNAVVPRRPGVCRLLVTQSGNAATYEAYPARLRTTVLAAGAPVKPPRLATVFSPASAGPHSYLRFHNTGSAEGTVTASVLDGATGEVVARWQSPSIPPGASPQFRIDELAGGTPMGPNLYSVRIDPETSITGYLQHVIFDQGLQAITNASTCDTGVMAPPYHLMNVHSTRIGARNPNTIIFSNVGSTQGPMSLTLRDATDGTVVGRFYSANLSTSLSGTSFTYPNGQVILNEDTMETVISTPSNPYALANISPAQASHFNMTDEIGITFSQDDGVFKFYYQNLVTNLQSGIVSDMSSVCALDGLSTATSNAKLRVAGVFSSLQTAAQSVFRFHNDGDVEGTVTVRVYGADDQPLGSWVSPAIPAGAMREVDIATVERELTLHKKDAYAPTSLRKENFYTLVVQTDVAGFFQHILRGTSDRALSNVSTCSDAVTTAGRTAMAVHPSSASVGTESAIVVTNTGPSAAAVRLNFYDARDGTLRGSYQTASIPAQGMLSLDVAAMETEGQISPPAGDNTVSQPPAPSDLETLWDDDFRPLRPRGGTATPTTTASAAPYYIVRIEEPFTGFLQHLIRDETHGVVSDMTTACML